MEAYRYRKFLSGPVPVLFDALELQKCRIPGRPFVISFTGGGGKTSFIRRLAWEGRKLGLRVLVFPTTHMAHPERFFVPHPSVEELEKAWETWGIAVTGRPQEQKPGVKKISFWNWEFYDQAKAGADLVLVEADGARCLPVKVPSRTEPVIPADTDLILCLYGLKALGQKGRECCFRLEQAAAILEDAFGPDGEDWVMDENHMACLMKQGYLEPLQSQFPDGRIVPVFNQADTKELILAGKRILDQTGAHEGLITGKLWEDPSFELF